MLKRFLGFLLASPLLIGFGYLFYLNPGAVEFRISAERVYSLPLPLLLLLAFLTGAALIFLLALLRETQWTIADWRRRRREERRERERSAVSTGRRLQREGLSEQARTTIRRSRPETDTLEATLVLAEAEIESERIDEARARLEGALVAHGDHPELRALLAEAHRRAGRRELANAELERAVALEPRSPKLLGALRDAYATEGRFVDALRTEERLLGSLRLPEQILLEEPRVRALRYQAALMADGDSTVVEELRAVVAQHPTFVPATVALGDRLRRLGHDHDAIRVWTRAAIATGSPVLLRRIEQAYLDAGQPKRVLALYQKIRRHADGPAIRLALTRFHLSQGELDEAARELESAGPEIETVPEYHALWAEMHRARGDARPALEALRRSLELCPAPAWVCRECGRREPRWEGQCPGCGSWDALEPILRG